MREPNTKTNPRATRSRADVVKRRARARAKERGAVMFIIAMTLALLGAMGVYALNMATYEVRASGYLRQSAQTHYVSEWAILGAAEALTLDQGKYVPAISASPSSANIPGLSNVLRTGCPSLAAVPLPPTSSTVARSCLMFWSGDLMSSVYGSGPLFNPLYTAPVNTPIEPWAGGGSDTTVGDYGFQNLSADFFIEFTDLTPIAPPPGTGRASPGTGQSQTCSYLVTVTGTGVTPKGGGTSNLGSGTLGGASASSPAPPNTWAATEGFEQTRSRIIFGPYMCGY